MDEKHFWQLIESSKSENDIEDQVDKIIQILEACDKKEIEGYDIIYKKLMGFSYTAHLWDACRLITCTGGEEAFVQFRNWLILQGKTLFFDAVSDPEILSNIVEDDNRYEMRCETFEYVAMTAYHNKTSNLFESLPASAIKLDGKLSKEIDLAQKFPLLSSKLEKC